MLSDKMKKMLVLGANGATGRLLVEILLKKGVEVIAIVRNAKTLTTVIASSSNLHIVEKNITEMPEGELEQYIRECEAVLCCLGHNLTFKGMFGHPRRLVTNAIKKVVKIIEAVNSNKKIKIILMNTTGNSNRDIPEKPPLSQRFVISILRFLLPPHADNENAADFLRLQIGQTSQTIEWVAVRPDALINEDQISQYDLYTSPIRNVIFDAGSVSRVNVAEFMSELATNAKLWDEWAGNMPVIYNHV